MGNHGRRNLKNSNRTYAKIEKSKTNLNTDILQQKGFREKIRIVDMQKIDLRIGIRRRNGEAVRN